MSEGALDEPKPMPSFFVMDDKSHQYRHEIGAGGTGRSVERGQG